MVYSGVFPPATLFFLSLLARASRSGGLGGFWRVTPPLQFRVSVKPFVIDAIGIWQKHSRKANCITKGADWPMQLLCSVSVIFNSIREHTYIYIYIHIYIIGEESHLCSDFRCSSISLKVPWKRLRRKAVVLEPTTTPRRPPSRSPKKMPKSWKLGGPQDS